MIELRAVRFAPWGQWHALQGTTMATLCGISPARLYDVGSWPSSPLCRVCARTAPRRRADHEGH